MAVARGKYMQVAERLSQRIKSGDYHVQSVPAERDLATEVGVSYTTVRKAVQKLLDAGLLYRQANGRLAVSGKTEQGTAKKQVALLVPAWESSEANLWNINLAQLRERFDFGSRAVHYMHWDDPAIVNTIRQFDATFMLPPGPPSSGFIDDLGKLDRPFVVLNRDWTQWGVRSVQLFPCHFIQKLLDHLASLGHRRIDCFNVQPCGQTIREWIGQWQVWSAAHQVDGELINEPVQPYTETLIAAYNVMDRRIREGKLNCSAMLCLTETSAIGTTRALLDHGIRPGHDIAVCTIGSKRCEYLHPSLTTLEEPDPKPYLAACIEWALDTNGRQWQGPLLVQPQDLKVVVRESTVPDAADLQKPQRMQLSETAGNNASQDAE